MKELFVSEIQEELLNVMKETSQNQGIYSGNMGKIVLCGLLFDYTGDKSFYSLLQRNMSDLNKNISSVEIINFKDGLSGIGWGIEWISQNKMVKQVNTDEVLEDFDDLLYKAVIRTRFKDLTLLNGLIGLDKYFIIRSKSKNPGTHRFRKIVNSECVNLIEELVSEDLNEKLTSANITQEQMLEEIDIITLGDILKNVSSSNYDQFINKDSVIKKAILYSQFILPKHIKQFRGTCIRKKISLLYLAANALLTSQNIDSQYHLLNSYIKEILVDLIAQKISESSELFRLLRVLILIYSYNNNIENETNLADLLVFLRKHMTRTSPIHNWFAYILGVMILDDRACSFKISELIFFE